MKLLLYKILKTGCAVTVALIVGCAIPSESELEISPFDAVPDISSHIFFPPGMQGGDSIVICFTPEAEFGTLEFACRIKLSDYTATSIFSSFSDDPDTLVFRGLSDNIGDQQWELTILGRYPGNALYTDTFDYRFPINNDTQSVQLSPSYILVNPLIDPGFYIDLNLDDIADSIVAGELCFCYENEYITCDSIVYPESDPLYYFLAGEGTLIHFTSYSAARDTIIFDFAFANGTVDGLPGSGRVIRMYFIAKKPGTCNLSLVKGRLKDIRNEKVAVSLTSASIHISYVEN